MCGCDSSQCYSEARVSGNGNLLHIVKLPTYSLPLTPHIVPEGQEESTPPVPPALGSTRPASGSEVRDGNEQATLLCGLSCTEQTLGLAWLQPRGNQTAHKLKTLNRPGERVSVDSSLF